MKKMHKIIYMFIWLIKRLTQNRRVSGLFSKSEPTLFLALTLNPLTPGVH